MCGDPRLDRFRRYPTIGQLVGPRTTRMKNIPRRTILRRPSIAWIVIAKAIHDGIPDWPRQADEHAFRHAYPNLVDNEVTTLEVRKFQIFRFAH